MNFNAFLKIIAIKKSMHLSSSGVLQQDAVRSKGIALIPPEKLNTVKIARNVLSIIIKFEVFATILRLEDNAGTSDSPHVVLVLPGTVDYTVAAGVDLARLEKLLNVNLV